MVKGENSFKLQKGQSIYILIEEKHSLTNESNEELEIIEVQSGEYLGEDDIYGRAK